MTTTTGADATTFPTLAAAVAHCAETMAHHHAAYRRSRAADAAASAAQTPSEAAATARWRAAARAARADAKDAHDTALATAYAALATDLLPPLLGGAWRPTQIGSLIRPGEWSLLTRPLVDHARAFRRADARGPTTWRNAVLVSEPYGVFDRTGAPAADALAQARRIRAELGVGVWGRADLSPWYPGWTALVLIAADLRPDAAARFGFTPLA